MRWLAAWGAILCSSIYLVAQIYGIGLGGFHVVRASRLNWVCFLALGGVSAVLILRRYACGDLDAGRAMRGHCGVHGGFGYGGVLGRRRGIRLSRWQPFSRCQKYKTRAKQIETDPAELATRDAISQRMSQLGCQDC